MTHSQVSFVPCTTSGRRPDIQIGPILQGGWVGIKLEADASHGHRATTVELSDIQASQNLQNERLNSDLGKYNVLNNSCLSNAADILREGGADIPKEGRALMEWAKTIFGSSR